MQSNDRFELKLLKLLHFSLIYTSLLFVKIYNIQLKANLVCLMGTITIDIYVELCL